MAKAFGKACYPLIVLLALATISLFIWTASTQRARARTFTAFLEPTASELTVALMRAGLGPEALTAAGASASAAATVVNDAREYMIANPAALSLADTSYASARQSVDQLKRLIQSGQGTDEDLVAYSAAKSQLFQATLQRQGVLDAVFGAGSASLNPSQTNRLAAIRNNSAWDRPTEFLVANRPDAQWVELRNVLAHTRITADLGETPAPEAVATLSEYAGYPQVAAAKARLDANLVVVTAAWEQAIGN
ncbi:MAG: hypothetical protein V3T53_06425 [Phycisphaerales bacterium]